MNFVVQKKNKNNFNERNLSDIQLPRAYLTNDNNFIPPLVTATTLDDSVPNPFHNKKIDTIIEKGSKVTEETVTSPGGTVIRRRIVHV